MLAMVDANGVSEKIAPGGVGPDGGLGYPCFGGPGFRIEGYLGGWAPGGRPWDLPEGVGMLLPKGARVVFQLHYHNTRSRRRSRSADPLPGSTLRTSPTGTSTDRASTDETPPK
jgi:hypothetical protein